MKKINLLLTNLFLIITLINGQSKLNFEWAQINKDNLPQKTAIDKNGNIYVAVGFSDTIDANWGSGSNLFISSSYASFIAKYDINRNFLWAKEVKGNNTRKVYDIYLNHDESSVVLLGEYIDSIYGDLSLNIPHRKALGGSDVFIARYSTVNGNFERLSSIGTAATLEYPVQAKFDQNGNQYILWSQRANGNSYLLVTKINSNYTAGYNFDMGTTNGLGLTGFGLDIDSNGVVAICGYHNRQVVFKNSSGTYSTINVETSGMNALFIIKLNSQGQGYSSAALKMVNTNLVLRGFAVAKSGEVYLSAAHNLQIFPELPGNGYGNIYLYHYDASLAMTWATRIMETGSEVFSNGLAVDEFSNVIISGTIGSNSQIVTNKSNKYYELFDTAAHSKVYIPTTFSKGSTYLAKWNNAGDLIWFKQFNLQGNNNFSQIITKGNQIYVTGRTYGTFKPVSESNSISEELGSTEAWYIIKYNQEWGAALQEQSLKATTLSVYPNPCQNSVNINSNIQFKNIEIYNINGVKVMSIYPDDFIKNIQLDELVNGVYIIKAFDEQQIYQAKFIVNRY